MNANSSIKAPVPQRTPPSIDWVNQSLSPLPPRIQTTIGTPPPARSPASEFLRQRPGRLVKRRHTLAASKQLQQRIHDAIYTVDDSNIHYNESRSLSYLDPETYHLHGGGTRKPRRFQYQTPQFRHRTDTQMQMYVVVRYEGQCMVFNSANPASSSPLDIQVCNSLLAMFFTFLTRYRTTRLL
jgi:hypothetical protein